MFCAPALLSWNIFADLQNMSCYPFLRHEFDAGTITAIIAGVTGYFVVLRRSAFSAHAFSEIGFAGAAWAVLVNIQPIIGLFAGSMLGGVAIALLGRRATNRDTQVGIVLAFSLGLGLLFLSLYTSGYASEAYSILFGDIEGVSANQVILTLIAGIAVLASIGFVYRPLLFTSLDEDVAEAKGMPMLAIGTAFMLLVAATVAFAVQVTGVLLIFSLMVTPAATAQYISTRPARAMLISVVIALMATWVGIFWDYYTLYPVSFFITGIVFFLYLLVRGIKALAKHHRFSARTHKSATGLGGQANSPSARSVSGQDCQSISAS